MYACHQYLETLFDFTLLASVSDCSLNFECPSLGYGFLSIILVLEKCNLGAWKSLKCTWICTLSLLRTLTLWVCVMWAEEWVSDCVCSQITSVARACCEFMASHLHPSNCVGVRNFAELHGHSELVAAADEFMLDNFTSVAQSDEFIEMTPHNLAALVTSAYLNVHSEVLLLSVCLSVCLSVGRSVGRSVGLSVCLSVWQHSLNCVCCRLYKLKCLRSVSLSRFHYWWETPL